MHSSGTPGARLSRLTQRLARLALFLSVVLLRRLLAQGVRGMNLRPLQTNKGVGTNTNTS